LFVIPFTVSAIDIPGFVARLAHAKNLALLIGNLQDVIVGEFVLPQKLKEMQALAGQKGGRCLSAAYINNSTPCNGNAAKAIRGEQFREAFNTEPGAQNVPDGLKQQKLLRSCRRLLDSEAENALLSPT